MRVVVQRVTSSSVTVNNKVIGKISNGLNILVGFTQTDTIEDLEYLKRKVLNLRIFNDENGVMNKSVLDTNGQILLISQFTLYADATKGNRPSFINAMKPDEATKLYDLFKVYNERLKVLRIRLDTAKNLFSGLKSEESRWRKCPSRLCRLLPERLMRKTDIPRVILPEWQNIPC